MPQVIPVVVAAWGAIGSATIAGVAVGGILQGAIVGAAIGGLTSAVTGGDIGKGMLFGAIGGAVLGGISGPMYTGGGTASSLGVGAGGKEAVMEGIKGSVTGTGAGDFAIQGVTKEVGKKAIEKTVEGGIKSTLIEGAMQIGGGVLQGLDEAKISEEQIAANERLTKLNQGFQSKENAANRDAQLAVAGMQRQTALDQIAENRRQFDTTLADQRAVRQQMAGALEGFSVAEADNAPKVDWTPITEDEKKQAEVLA